MPSNYAMSLDANALLNVLHLPDPPPGHTSLQNHLGWQPSTYKDAKNELVSLRLAAVGHGGSLRRAQPPEGWVAPVARTSADVEPWEFAPVSTKESLLYIPLVSTLKESWKTDQNPQII